MEYALHVLLIVRIATSTDIAVCAQCLQENMLNKGHASLIAGLRSMSTEYALRVHRRA